MRFRVANGSQTLRESKELIEAAHAHAGDSEAGRDQDPWELLVHWFLPFNSPCSMRPAFSRPRPVRNLASLKGDLSAKGATNTTKGSGHDWEPSREVLFSKRPDLDETVVLEVDGVVKGRGAHGKGLDDAGELAPIAQGVRDGIDALLGKLKILSFCA